MANEINERIDQIAERIDQHTATLKEFKEFNSLLDELLLELPEWQDKQNDYR